MAAHLVKQLAKYAAGSGISEIKCIIGGFIMKGFLGFWTFFIKSVTLVRESELCALTSLHSYHVASRHCVRAFRRERGSIGACRVLCGKPDSKSVQGILEEPRWVAVCVIRSCY